MEYSNPQIPEGINVTKEHPLKEVAQLAVGVLVLVAIVLAALAYGVGYLARLVPFKLEEQVASSYSEMLPKHTAQTAYLQGLAERLAKAQQLPKGMRVHVHFVDEEDVNAMATIAGHVFVFRGLLDVMPSENALAMVLAHEIAHVKHRDPIVALGRSAFVGFALAALGVSSGRDAASSALGQAGLLTTLTFNRDQEREADREALSTLATLYGHVNGADTAFERLKDAAEPVAEMIPEVLSTHPGTQARIERLRELAKQQGFRTRGELTPLPATATAP